MRIALIIKDYSLKKGGLERYVVNLSNELLNMGHEVHVIANYWDKPVSPEIIFHKVPIIKFSFFFKNISFVRNTRKLLNKDFFDIISGFSRIYPLDAYRIGHKVRQHLLKVQYPSKFERFLKYISIRHLTILYLEKQIFKKDNFRKIIANSNLGKSHAILYYKVPEDKIEVIYNGVDLKKFNPQVKIRYRDAFRKKLGLSEDDILILFVGRNFRLKGVKNIIQSLPLIRGEKDKIHVLIVGKGKPSSFLRLAGKLGVKDRIVFEGESHQIEKFYAAGDIFVLPTLYDPFANVCLEAFACGIPVITTRMNGAAEIIEQGKNGFVIGESAPADELAQKITQLLSRKLREKMGRHAFETAKKYTLTQNAEKVEKLYQEIVANR